jgi:glycosyltransferase involved in cell wall biosynthesis
MKKNPKLLLFSDWFYPGYKAGGPIKSVTNLSIALQQDFDVYLFTADTDLNETTPYPNIKSNTWVKPIQGSNVQVFYCSKDYLNRTTIKAIIKEVNPTSIYLNHLWSYWFVLQPLFICWLQFKKIKIVLCPRGALFESALHYLKTYPKKRVLIAILKSLRIHKKIHFHATTPQEKETIEKYFSDVKISIANNLPDLHQPTLSTIEKKQGELKLVFIARIVDIKNLKLLLQNLQKVTSNIALTIAGPSEDKNYWEDCKSIMSKFLPNIQVNYVGEIAPSQVMPLIKEHHLYCLPTQGENFGHSIFESFMIGRPVLISNKTPWLNLNEKNAGWEVDIIQSNSFVPFLEEAANWQQQTFDEYCKGAWLVANEYINNPKLVSTYYPMFEN